MERGKQADMRHCHELNFGFERVYEQDPHLVTALPLDKTDNWLAEAPAHATPPPACLHCRSQLYGSVLPFLFAPRSCVTPPAAGMQASRPGEGKPGRGGLLPSSHSMPTESHQAGEELEVVRR